MALICNECDEMVDANDFVELYCKFYHQRTVRIGGCAGRIGGSHPYTHICGPLRERTEADDVEDWIESHAS